MNAQAIPPMPVSLVAPAAPVPMPAPVNPESGMTDKQKVMFRTFKELHRRATAYVAGTHFDDEDFDKDYGICDNIANSVHRDFLVDGITRNDARTMSTRVKDNIICRTPSFSGSFSYPVPHPDFINHEDPAVRRRKAELAWDECNGRGARWLGEYGAARINQLAEMIDIIQHKWDDKMASHMTPAQRNGIDKNSIVTIEGQEGLWKLYRDDESSDPYFQPVGNEGDQGVKHFGLSYVKVLDSSATCEPMTVPEFLAQHEKLLADKKEAEDEVARIKQMLAAAQLRVTKVMGDIAMNDYHLGQQHKVRRM